MDMRRWLFAVVIVASLVFSGCSLKQQADAQFGDQNFKTAIALIELYKTRYGHYPETLHELTFTGQWDQIGLNSVEYKRIGNGYMLNIVRGWVGQPTLSYPADFWQGLGVVSSNVGGVPHTATATTSGV